MQDTPIQNRGFPEIDRKINHAKSKPHGDMAASIFDWLIDRKLNMQNKRYVRANLRNMQINVDSVHS